MLKIKKIIYEIFFFPIIFVLFFAVITPIAYLLRLIRIDFLKLKQDQKINTYWNIK